MKITAMLASAGLLLTVLAACGSGSDGDSNSNSDNAGAGSSTAVYCAALEPIAKEHFSGTDPEIADPQAAYTALRGIAGSAPTAIESEWKVMDDGIQGLFEAMDTIGATAKDLDDILEGKSPDGLSMSLEDAVEVLKPSLDTMTSPEFMAAQEAVQEHAKTECKVDLNIT